MTTPLVWYDDTPPASMGPCPECGGQTRAHGDCHTWPGGERADGTRQWMSCLSCYSAARIDCAENDGDGCGWPGYTWGLNPRNPRADDNERFRPSWLNGECPL